MHFFEHFLSLEIILLAVQYFPVWTAPGATYDNYATNIELTIPKEIKSTDCPDCTNLMNFIRYSLNLIEAQKYDVNGENRDYLCWKHGRGLPLPHFPTKTPTKCQSASSPAFIIFERHSLDCSKYSICTKDSFYTINCECQQGSEFSIEHQTCVSSASDCPAIIKTTVDISDNCGGQSHGISKPNFRDCTKYYKCTSLGNEHSLILEYQCPSHQGFDPISSTCRDNYCGTGHSDINYPVPGPEKLKQSKNQDYHGEYDNPTLSPHENQYSNVKYENPNLNPHENQYYDVKYDNPNLSPHEDQYYDVKYDSSLYPHENQPYPANYDAKPKQPQILNNQVHKTLSTSTTNRWQDLYTSGHYYETDKIVNNYGCLEQIYDKYEQCAYPGFFSIFDDCTSYIICIAGPQNTHLAYRTKCPDEKTFSKSYRRCVQKDYQDCGTKYDDFNIDYHYNSENTTNGYTNTVEVESETGLLPDYPERHENNSKTEHFNEHESHTKDEYKHTNIKLPTNSTENVEYNENYNYGTKDIADIVDTVKIATSTSEIPNSEFPELTDTNIKLPTNSTENVEYNGSYNYGKKDIADTENITIGTSEIPNPELPELTNSENINVEDNTNTQVAQVITDKEIIDTVKPVYEKPTSEYVKPCLEDTSDLPKPIPSDYSEYYPHNSEPMHHSYDDFEFDESELEEIERILDDLEKDKHFEILNTENLHQLISPGPETIQNLPGSKIVSLGEIGDTTALGDGLLDNLDLESLAPEEIPIISELLLETISDDLPGTILPLEDVTGTLFDNDDNVGLDGVTEPLEGAASVLNNLPLPLDLIQNGGGYTNSNPIYPQDYSGGSFDNLPLSKVISPQDQDTSLPLEYLPIADSGILENSPLDGVADTLLDKTEDIELEELVDTLEGVTSVINDLPLDQIQNGGDIVESLPVISDNLPLTELIDLQNQNSPLENLPISPESGIVDILHLNDDQLTGLLDDGSATNLGDNPIHITKLTDADIGLLGNSDQSSLDDIRPETIPTLSEIPLEHISNISPDNFPVDLDNLDDLGEFEDLIFHLEEDTTVLDLDKLMSWKKDEHILSLVSELADLKSLPLENLPLKRDELSKILLDKENPLTQITDLTTIPLVGSDLLGNPDHGVGTSDNALPIISELPTDGAGVSNLDQDLNTADIIESVTQKLGDLPGLSNTPVENPPIEHRELLENLPLEQTPTLAGLEDIQSGTIPIIQDSPLKIIDELPIQDSPLENLGLPIGGQDDLKDDTDKLLPSLTEGTAVLNKLPLRGLGTGDSIKGSDDYSTSSPSKHGLQENAPGLLNTPVENLPISNGQLLESLPLGQTDEIQPETILSSQDSPLDILDNLPVEGSPLQDLGNVLSIGGQDNLNVDDGELIPGLGGGTNKLPLGQLGTESSPENPNQEQLPVLSNTPVDNLPINSELLENLPLGQTPDLSALDSIEPQTILGSQDSPLNIIDEMPVQDLPIENLGDILPIGGQNNLKNDPDKLSPSLTEGTSVLNKLPLGQLGSEHSPENLPELSLPVENLGHILPIEGHDDLNDETDELLPSLTEETSLLSKLPLGGLGTGDSLKSNDDDYTSSQSNHERLENPSELLYMPVEKLPISNDRLLESLPLGQTDDTQPETILSSQDPPLGIIDELPVHHVPLENIGDLLPIRGQESSNDKTDTFLPSLVEGTSVLNKLPIGQPGADDYVKSKHEYYPSSQSNHEHLKTEHVENQANTNGELLEGLPLGQTPPLSTLAGSEPDTILGSQDSPLGIIDELPIRDLTLENLGDILPIGGQDNSNVDDGELLPDLDEGTSILNKLPLGKLGTLSSPENPSEEHLPVLSNTPAENLPIKNGEMLDTLPLGQTPALSALDGFEPQTILGSKDSPPKIIDELPIQDLPLDKLSDILPIGGDGNSNNDPSELLPGLDGGTSILNKLPLGKLGTQSSPENPSEEHLPILTNTPAENLPTKNKELLETLPLGQTPALSPLDDIEPETILGSQDSPLEIIKELPIHDLPLENLGNILSIGSQDNSNDDPGELLTSLNDGTSVLNKLPLGQLGTESSDNSNQKPVLSNIQSQNLPTNEELLENLPLGQTPALSTLDGTEPQTILGSQDSTLKIIKELPIQDLPLENLGNILATGGQANSNDDLSELLPALDGGTFVLNKLPLNGLGTQSSPENPSQEHLPVLSNTPADNLPIKNGEMLDTLPLGQTPALGTLDGFEPQTILGSEDSLPEIIDDLLIEDLPLENLSDMLPIGGQGNSNDDPSGLLPGLDGGTSVLNKLPLGQLGTESSDNSKQEPVLPNTQTENLQTKNEELLQNMPLGQTPGLSTLDGIEPETILGSQDSSPEIIKELPIQDLPLENLGNILPIGSPDNSNDDPGELLTSLNDETSVLNKLPLGQLGTEFSTDNSNPSHLPVLSNTPAENLPIKSGEMLDTLPLGQTPALSALDGFEPQTILGSKDSPPKIIDELPIQDLPLENLGHLLPIGGQDNSNVDAGELVPDLDEETSVLNKLPLGQLGTQSSPENSDQEGLPILSNTHNGELLEKLPLGQTPALSTLDGSKPETILGSQDSPLKIIDELPIQDLPLENLGEILPIGGQDNSNDDTDKLLPDLGGGASFLNKHPLGHLGADDSVNGKDEYYPYTPGNSNPEPLGNVGKLTNSPGEGSPLRNGQLLENLPLGQTPALGPLNDVRPDTIPITGDSPIENISALDELPIQGLTSEHTPLGIVSEILPLGDDIEDAGLIKDTEELIPGLVEDESILKKLPLGQLNKHNSDHSTGAHDGEKYSDSIGDYKKLPDSPLENLQTSNGELLENLSDTLPLTGDTLPLLGQSKVHHPELGHTSSHPDGHRYSGEESDSDVGVGKILSGLGNSKSDASQKLNTEVLVGHSSHGLIKPYEDSSAYSSTLEENKHSRPGLAKDLLGGANIEKTSKTGLLQGTTNLGGNGGLTSGLLSGSGHDRRKPGLLG